jgi:hypothetical protein
MITVVLEAQRADCFFEVVGDVYLWEVGEEALV